MIDTTHFPIVRLFGKHVDLKKVITISDIWLWAPEESTPRVGFSVTVQLSEQGIKFDRYFEDSDWGEKGLMYTDGTSGGWWESEWKGRTPVPIASMQPIHDEFVALWAKASQAA